MFDSNNFGNYFERPLMPSDSSAAGKRTKSKSGGSKIGESVRAKKTPMVSGAPVDALTKDARGVYKNYVFKKLRTKSENPNRAMDAIFVNAKTGKEKVVSFGKNGQCTFLSTKDPTYRAWYRQSYPYNEDELMSPNALTNLILFNKLTIEDSLKDYKNKLRRANKD